MPKKDLIDSYQSWCTMKSKKHNQIRQQTAKKNKKNSNNDDIALVDKTVSVFLHKKTMCSHLHYLTSFTIIHPYKMWISVKLKDKTYSNNQTFLLHNNRLNNIYSKWSYGFSLLSSMAMILVLLDKHYFEQLLSIFVLLSIL